MEVCYLLEWTEAKPSSVPADTRPNNDDDIRHNARARETSDCHLNKLFAVCPVTIVTNESVKDTFEKTSEDLLCLFSDRPETFVWEVYK